MFLSGTVLPEKSLPLTHHRASACSQALMLVLAMPAQRFVTFSCP